uniref:Uncharacterized protein n=1 Tax=Macaca nemestrina TaxID=9545 RepID=A0A2K6CWE2_MACNE
MTEAVTTRAGQCREKHFMVTESNPAGNGCNGEALEHFVSTVSVDGKAKVCPSPTGDTKPPPWVDLTDIEVSLPTKEKRSETAMKTSTRYQKES